MLKDISKHEEALLKFSRFVLINSANTVPKAINRAICPSLRLNLWKIANFVFLRRSGARSGRREIQRLLPDTEPGLLSSSDESSRSFGATSELFLK